MLDDVLTACDLAWNVDDPAERARLLDRALTADAELIDPSGRFEGRNAIDRRIAGFAERFPGARVSVTSGVDEHHDWARYAWTISDRDGNRILTGIDIVQRAGDRRLQRVIMFFGDLPGAD